MEVSIFTDFDDIAAPPEPIVDLDRVNNAEQVQVSDECPELEDSKEVDENLAPWSASWKNLKFSLLVLIFRQFQSQDELHRHVVSVMR